MSILPKPKEIKAAGSEPAKEVEREAPTTPREAPRVVITGVYPKKAVIHDSAGRKELSIKRHLGDTKTDFVYENNRYIFDPDTIKLKTPNWVIGIEIAMLYGGVMFLLVGLLGQAPVLDIWGVMNILAGLMTKGGESMIKETYSDWFAGQMRPFKYLSAPEFNTYSFIRDKSGNIKDIKMHDARDFDEAILPHAIRDFSSGGMKLNPKMLMWIIIAVIGIAVLFGVLKMAHVIKLLEVILH